MIPIEKEKEQCSLDVAGRMDGSKSLKSHLLREQAERGSEDRSVCSLRLIVLVDDSKTTPVENTEHDDHERHSPILNKPPDDLNISC